MIKKQIFPERRCDRQIIYPILSPYLMGLGKYRLNLDGKSIFFVVHNEKKHLPIDTVIIYTEQKLSIPTLILKNHYYTIL